MLLESSPSSRESRHGQDRRRRRVRRSDAIPGRMSAWPGAGEAGVSGTWGHRVTGRAAGFESRGDRHFSPRGLEDAETGYRDKETCGRGGFVSWGVVAHRSLIVNSRPCSCVPRTPGGVCSVGPGGTVGGRPHQGGAPSMRSASSLGPLFPLCRMRGTRTLRHG